MTEKIKQMEAKLQRATRLEEKVDLLNALAFEMQYSDLTKAFNYTEQALALNTDPVGGAYQKGKAESLCNRGYFPFEKGKLKKGCLISSKPWICTGKWKTRRERQRPWVSSVCLTCRSGIMQKRWNICINNWRSAKLWGNVTRKPGH